MPVFEITPAGVHPPFPPGTDQAAERGTTSPARQLLPRPWRKRVRAFDRAVDHELDHFRGHPVADKTMYGLSELADFSLLWHFAGSVKALRSGRVEDAVRLSAILGIESLLVNGLVKSLFGRVRPRRDTPHPIRLRQPLTSSFPSGHASAAFTAAALLSEDSRAWPVWYTAAGLVAISRVYVRIHHASDVVGGIATGIVLGRLARRLWPRHGPGE
jgi:undecaprenyl-diphosphatase